MPNLASILKIELSRLARKAVRAETASLKKAVSGYRTEIAALKRRTQTLEQQLRRSNAGAPKAAAPLEEAAVGGRRRFSAKGLTSQRRRLGLSARECGLLLGTSAQSIYNWEDGKTRPLARHLQAIGALGALGKREARSVIEARRAGA